jgi:hypothetical protein
MTRDSVNSHMAYGGKGTPLVVVAGVYDDFR